MLRRPVRPVHSLLALALLAGCGGGDEEDSAPYTCPAAAPAISCDAGATIDSAMDVDSLVGSEAPVTSFDGPIKALLCATWESSGRPLVEQPKLQLLPEGEFVAARDTHPVFKGRDGVPGFIVHDPAAPEGQKECIVMPSKWAPAEFVEVMQHEVGHVRQSERGEQEAELAEIVQALTTAQIHPEFGSKLLEGIFDIKVGYEPNVVGHAHALMALTANGGDFAGAHAALQGWTDAAGLAALKATCGCDDPLADSEYKKFAEPFVDALAGFTPVPGAAADEGLVDIQAFLRWRLAFALNEIDGGGRDFITEVDATEDYIKGRDTAGHYHAWVTRAATQILAAKATPADGPAPEDPAERFGYWKRIVEINAVYPTQGGEDDAMRYDQYLRAYSTSAGIAATEHPDPDTVTWMSDTFLARHGETPAETCARQTAAEVFHRRGSLEFATNGSACDGKPWFERAQALFGWDAADDCGIAWSGAPDFVAGEMTKIEGHNCDG